MAILILEDTDEALSWKAALATYLPEVEIRVALNEGDPADIEVVILWDKFEVCVLNNGQKKRFAAHPNLSIWRMQYASIRNHRPP